MLPAEIYFRVFERSPIGKLVYVWESPPELGSFRLIAQNSAALRFGSSREELGQPIAANPRLLATDVPARYANVLDTGEPHFFELDWENDGRLIHYELQCFPVGERHLVVFFTDSTHKKNVEESLARRLRELERSNRELDDFAYVASHDLKSPLRDIHNLATWIAEDLGTNLAPDTARHISVLRERVERMDRLLDDLLQYSRAGRGPQVTEQVSLREVVREVEALLRPAHHEIVVESDHDVIEASRVAVMVVLRNLIANAIKHDDRPNGRIFVSLTPSDEGTFLDVRDEGPGIPPRFHERVFRLFQTLRPRDESSSSGMGLAIVKKIAESCGGRAEIESNGRGTIVRTLWPKPGAS